jgi:hypothetical protein
MGKLRPRGPVLCRRSVSVIFLPSFTERGRERERKRQRETETETETERDSMQAPAQSDPEGLVVR